MKRWTPTFLRKDEGLGMTELAVAILVLGIVLIGLFPMMVDSVRLAQNNAEVARANVIVSSQIDKARGSLASAPCVIDTTGVGLMLPVDEANRFLSKRFITKCEGRLATVKIVAWRKADIPAGEQPTIDTPGISTATTRVMVGT